MINKCENCGNCCIETEMIISEEDINLILEKCQDYIKIQDFYIKNKDNFFQLKNIEGQCVFFNNKLKICTIYQYRPQGCKFYPMIFDFHRKKCILDKDCPRTDLFYQGKGVWGKDCNNLKRFLKDHLNLDVI